jgi:hypothetical protein
MAKRQDISADLARQLLDYDPETGILRWKPRSPEHFRPTRRQTAADRCKNWNSRYAGKIAGGKLDDRGYITVSIFDNHYLAHRLIWLIMTGEWPEHEIDHRYGDGGNNKWEDIRKATPSQNQHNKGLSKRNKSGFTGVTPSKDGKRWRARICLNWKEVSLGEFYTSEEAAEAYRKAKAKFHPFQPIPREG